MRLRIIIVVLSLLPPLCMAGNPASTSYVDQQVALAKAALVARINSSTAIAHPVGSCYGGGVVFYVNTTPNAPVGQQGLIAALTDVSNATYLWNTNPSSINTATALFTGASNTAIILQSPDGQAGNTQAAIAANGYTEGTYHDWYLPSQSELSQLQIQLNTTSTLFTKCTGTNPSSANQYWSSSRYDTDNAWYISFGNGVVYVNPVNTSYLVRAIRAF